MNDDELMELMKTDEGKAMLDMKINVGLRAIDIINIRSAIAADLKWPEKLPADLVTQLRELEVTMSQAMTVLSERH